MKRVSAIFTLACVLMVWVSTASGEAVEAISPYELRQASKNNLDAAREQYLNRQLLIKGVVVSTGMSRYLTPTVVLADLGEEVICVLPYVGISIFDRKAQLSDYRQGQTVTMSGRVHAMSLERLVLKDCAPTD